MKRSFWRAAVLSLLAAFFAGGLVAQQANPLLKLDPLAQSILRQDRAGLRRLAKKTGVDAEAADPTVKVFLRTPAGTSRVSLQAIDPALQLRTQAGNIFTATVPIRLLTKLAASGAVTSIHAARKAHKVNDIARSSTTSGGLYLGMAAADQGLAGYNEVNGQGVVVGDVDTGIDFRHSDFISGGATRIAYIWDQCPNDETADPPNTCSGGSGTGISFTQGVPSAPGTEYTASDINADLAISSCLNAGTGCTHVAERDVDGHGTHVTGSMAGNGATYTGMAPQSTIIFVRTSFVSTDIVDGVQYIFNRAGSSPAVVNLSLGIDLGPHDGTDPFDLGISNLEGPGKLVVAAAGNDGGNPIHGSATNSSGSTTFTMTADPSYSAPAVIDFWYANANSVLYNVTVSWTGESLTADNGAGNQDSNVSIDNNDSNLSGDGGLNANEVYVQILPASPPTGNITITFTRASGSGSDRIDGWNDGSTDFSSPDTTMLVGEPADSSQIVAVGAYVTRVTWNCAVKAGSDCTSGSNSITYSPAPTIGAIAPFSSVGPNRINQQKPDISAPGMGIVSTLSIFSSQDQQSVIVDPPNGYFVDQGTSMATPHIAGTLAMLLQENPSLTETGAGSALAALQSRARTDAQASVGNTWGYGKALGTPPAFQLASQFSGAGASPASITWTWNNNALNVDLFRSSDSFNISGSVPASAGSFTQTGLGPNELQSVELQVSNDAGTSTSAVTTAYSLAAVPGTPSTAAASVFLTSMTVTWSSSGNSGITPYELDYSTNNFTTFTVAVPLSSDVTSTTATITGLTPATQYALRVRAENGQDVVTSYSPTGFASTLGPVTGVAGAGSSTTSILWSWNLYPGATDYAVFDAGSGTLLTNGTTNFYSETTSGPNVSKAIVVQGYVPGETIPLSASATAYSQAATPNSAAWSTGTTTSLSFSWSGNGNPGGTLFDAELDNNDFAGQTLATSTGASTSATFSSLAVNTTYYFRVRALNGQNLATAYTSILSTATDAAAPSGLVLDSATLTTGSISWNANGNPSDTPYELDLSTTSTPDGSIVVPSTAGFTATTATFGSLTPYTSYYCSVRAFNRLGVPTAYSTPLQFFTSPTVSSAPVGPGLPAFLTVRNVSVNVPANAFLVATTLTLDIPGTLPTGPSNVGSLQASGVGFQLTPANGEQPSASLTVSLTYDPAVIASEGISAGDLVIARFDVTGVWVPLPSSVDTADHVVTTQIGHFSTYQLMAAPQSSGLNPNVVAFPDPVYTSRGQTMTFSGLANGQSLKIYTISGQLVRELSASGSLASWDGKNSSGSPVASGVYIVLISDGSSHETIKVMVER